MGKHVQLVSAFPGAGKSTLAEEFGWLDIDSSDFGDKNDPERWETFQVPYVDAIVKAMGEAPDNSVIFCSSHSQVREELARREIPYISIFPEPRFIETYMERFEDRGDSEEFKQLIRAKHREWIRDMQLDEGVKHTILLHKGQPYIGLTSWAILNAPATHIRTVRNTRKVIRPLNQFVSDRAGTAYLVIGVIEVEPAHDAPYPDFWVMSISGKREVKKVSGKNAYRKYIEISNLGDHLVQNETRRWQT